MNPNEALQKAKEALTRAIEARKLNEDFLKSVGPAILDALTPVLREIADNSKLSKEELLSAIAGIDINVPKVEVPKAEVQVQIPEIKVPQPVVNVSVPEIKIPSKDMIETNRILQAILNKAAKEDKPVEVSVELKIV